MSVIFAVQRGEKEKIQRQSHLCTATQHHQLTLTGGGNFIGFSDFGELFILNLESRGPWICLLFF